MINLKSILILVFFVLFILVLSCNIKSYTLLNKVTTVPKNVTVYKNKSKFVRALLLKQIDTSVVYEEYNLDKNILMRLDPCIECRVYGIYKFYSNGCFNAFYLNRDKILSATEFNPLFAGKRGVYYTENNKIKYDLFAEIDERQHLGKISGTLSFNGDTMYLKRDEIRGIDKTDYPTRIFLKRKLPAEYFVYKANW